MKTKSKLWLGVCAVVLCFGAMAFGVYSALSANLNINGMLGFNMHNAIVELSGTISPVAEEISSGRFTPTTKEIKKTAMGGEEKTVSNLNLGDLYFYAKEDMVFDFSFKNIGTAPINMIITIDLGENADKISIAEHIDYIPFSDNTYENFILADDTKHIKFALKLNDTANEIGKNAFSINFSFVEAGVTLTNGYYEGIQYTLDSNTPVATTNTSSSTASFLSSSVKPLANKTVYTASVSGYDSTAIANYPNAKIQPFVTDGTNLYMVTSIGSKAFYNYTNITSVTIPDSVTSIGSKAFYNCTGLRSLTIGSNVTKIGERSFFRFDINKVNISSLESWCNIDFTDAYANPLSNELYLNGVKITDLRIPDGVTSIGQYAFNGFKALTSVTIPDSVTSIGAYAFDGCTSLESYYDTENDPNKILKYLGNESNNYLYLWGVTNTSLTTATINSKTKFIGDSVFKECTSLTGALTIPNGVISIGEYAFYKCSGLTGALTIPNGVTNIGEYAFYYCSGLTSVTIPDSVTSIGAYAFDGCTSLESYYDTENDPNKILKYLGNESNNYLYLSGVTDTSLTAATINSKTKFIGEYAFGSCTGLTSVTIPDSVQSIGEHAFDACRGLTSVTIGSGVKSIGEYAFYNCSGLTGALTIPNGVTSIGEHAFDACCFTSVTIGSGVKSIGEYAFYNCYKLTSVTIPDSVKSIGEYAFDACTGLTSVTIPDSVQSIGAYAFRNCYELTSVTIPDSVKSIGEYAFGSCTGLTSVTIGSGVQSIGSYAFYFCSSLTSVTIGSGVQSIGSYAFNFCSSLTSVTIPDSVKSIGSYAFYYCSGLTSVTFESTTPPGFGTAVFNGCSALTNIYVPNETAKTAYLADSYLSTLTSVEIKVKQ